MVQRREGLYGLYESSSEGIALKYVGVSMRVDVHSTIEERRDAIDQRWYAFLKECGFFPILLPNTLDTLNILNDYPVNGVLLTGGNTLGSLGGTTQERDQLETALIKRCISFKLPVLGVCHGMQIIQNYFGIKLKQIPNHVAVRHAIIYKNEKLEVNSYHDYGTYDTTSNELNVIGMAEDGIVESVQHVDLPIQGIMWHPERELEFRSFDKNIFKEHFLGLL
jgi:N5-(cytidine 5'-diphosphoramidyl)-L-glutamine hydrolase